MPDSCSNTLAIPSWLHPGVLHVAVIIKTISLMAPPYVSGTALSRAYVVLTVTLVVVCIRTPTVTSIAVVPTEEITDFLVLLGAYQCQAVPEPKALPSRFEGC